MSSRGYERLPMSWGGASSAKSAWYRPRTFLGILKFALPSTVLVLFVLWYHFEPHIEVAVYNRKWVQQEIEQLAPLAGCFDPARVSARYNVSEAVYGRKKMEVQAGTPMRMGLDCYDFAGTVRAEPNSPSHPASTQPRTDFHSYWRNDLAPFGERQEWMLKSFFATQDVSATRFVLWSNGDLGGNPILQKYAQAYPESFALRIVDVEELARGTELAGSALLKSKDSKAWTDGDLIRLLLLWTYGGIWIDMDSLLTRDLEPLLEHEFVTQWDCYDKLYQPFNGALMRFRQHSPYLCEAFHIMATSSPPRAGSTDWGSLLYHKLWRRLIAASIPPFKILPFCFSDGRSCRLDNRLPDPFVADTKDGQWALGLGREAGGGLDKALGNVFAVHLHNQWEKAFPTGGWVDRLLLSRYDERLKGGPGEL
ncbi:glycosyltransferase family 32 protein [Athelia psychrophila]|uniref:Glycosyltransferase family 32 protein n=1 Tax=Athelia psychrophila TaxID=1759441 RepID=A0A166LK81_9AGAM|nr:glycosyltransferase family 32 protein [Fibularhizoctonia sp. CBS 109695]